jgi:very-short-patch-repair endonuclease
MLREPTLQASSRTHLDRTVTAFRSSDRRRVELSAGRVLRRHAEHALEVFNAFPAAHQLVKKEAGKKARHLAFRALFGETSDVLTALCPCVMASPLSVSQLLPPRGDLFDVVIFDEASQVQPEDAAPALLRAPQVVVAGDPKQLPPTTFFASETEQDDSEDSLTGLESVLDALLTVFPSWKLSWHYRSRDERLIAYSNRTIYQDSLITFPGTNREEPVVFEPVPFVARDGQEDSSSEEVKLVVQRILEHARARPQVSLGVITMGIKHRDRLQHALDEALLADGAGLASFFDLQRPDRFFIKNLEQVQGDERDEIFLSVGYAKNADGRLPYRFGPILISGGERRLNVATTRAKQRMRVFCSFNHLDLDPKRSSSEGFKYLRGFLEFAASGGRILNGEEPTSVALNPFEEDVRLALESRGLQVVPQLGVSGYRIDFAVQHPEQQGRFIMAIECDGASYHSAPMARDRDRLRQQQLQALGWRVYRIWSTDWFHHRAEELERVTTEVQRVLAEGDDPAEPPAPSRRLEGPPTTGSPLVLRGAKPWVPADPKIESVPPQTIWSVIQWIQADGILRTNEELIAEVAKEMGFKRMGNRIRETIANFLLEKH